MIRTNRGRRGENENTIAADLNDRRGNRTSDAPAAGRLNGIIR